MMPLKRCRVRSLVSVTGLTIACLALPTVVLPTVAAAQYGTTYRGTDDRGAREAAARQVRAEIDAARSQMDAARARVRAAFAADADLTAAEREANDAQTAYDAARQRVVARLSEEDEAYRRAVSAVEQAQSLVAENQPADPMTAAAGLPADRPITPDDVAIEPPSEDLTAAAQDALDRRAEVTRLEDEALSRDARATEAKATLDAAVARRTGLEQQLEAEILNDADYQAAQQRMSDARSRLPQPATGVGGVRY